MANKTIYGCYKPSTGEVLFVGEACDSGDYTGCLVTSGEHAGQIAVTISEVNCDDTYYACFNPSTGKFQLVIPDDCCYYTLCVLPTCYCEYGNDSGVCQKFPNGETPKYIVITFEGVKKCSNGTLWSAINQSFCLTQTGNSSIWSGSGSIDGDSVTITYDASGGMYNMYAEMYSSTKFYFQYCGTNFCRPSGANNIGSGAFLCPNYCDDEITSGKTAVAELGSFYVCNPCTGTWGVPE